VAVHAWDCHGAKRAGLTTRWASRLQDRYGSLSASPADVTGADLTEVADGLLALPASNRIQVLASRAVRPPNSPKNWAAACWMASDQVG
jgi:hypothetical protein